MTPLLRTNFALFSLLLLLLAAGSASGQTPRPSLLSTPAPTNAPPPRELKLVEKKWGELADQTPSEAGQKALAIDATKWRHAETENFTVHFRRMTEAQKVGREIEYDLWYVATTLGATRERYRKKSHVYVFEDEAEWQQFLSVLNSAPKWAASFALGDELFLNVRGKRGEGFDSQTLAHETTHAVVARLFPGKRWPLWLNEGFAEYMGGASIAARKGQSVKRYQKALQMAEMPLETLANLTAYPSDEVAIGQLYQTSEKFVRFLMTELPKDRIVKFIDTALEGKTMPEAVLAVYGDKFADWEAFMKRYERFNR